MMFDPPDFPYKELTESIREQYSPDKLIFNNDNGNRNHVTSINNDLLGLTEHMISNVESQLLFNSNDSGRFFNLDNETPLHLNNSRSEHSTESFVVQSDSLFTDEPALLDENTINQFLLPTSTENNEETTNIGPDLLSLHSCVICHEIFTTDADLLDHTISLHASLNVVDPNPNGSADTFQATAGNSRPDFECEWLVCSTCQRVLSTALEIEPTEQLCCRDDTGKCSISSRKLESMFVCDLCSGLFADGDALDSHRLMCYVQDEEYAANTTVYDSNSERHSEVFICKFCSKECLSVDELESHVLDCRRPVIRRIERRAYSTSNNNKMWNCGSCNQLFSTARELYRHKRGEDRPPGAPLMAYVCEECDKVLGSMCALYTHKKMHKNSKPGYACRVCGRRFNQSGHLAIHMRMHTGERPYPCDLCPKAFKVKVERDDHRRTHTGERPFACTACPKTFTAAARLREHARIHTDQRPYRCDICGAAFRRPYARTVHTLIHTGEKPHECDVCGTAFRRSGDMWKHKRTLHGIQSNNEADKAL